MPFFSLRAGLILIAGIVTSFEPGDEVIMEALSRKLALRFGDTLSSTILDFLATGAPLNSSEQRSSSSCASLSARLRLAAEGLLGPFVL